MKKFKFLLSIICLCLFLSILMFFANSVNATVEEDLHSQTKITSTTNTVQAPTITVLTHGFGASYKHWSNDGSSNDFAYNSNSIIAKMFTELENNLNIYIADSSSTINTDGILTLSFDLKKMTYNDYVNNIAPKTTAMIDDVSKHILLIFDSAITKQGHDEVYEEFHYILDNVSLQYKSLTGVLPKYNLIGHSRGGITNIMYATEHPYNVYEIFSIGTPYNGSALGGIEPIISMLGYSTFDSTTNTYVPNTADYPGITDVLSSEVNKGIRDAWNEVKTADVNINVTAYGSMTSIDLMREIVNDVATNQVKYGTLGSTVSNIQDVLNTIINIADDNPNLVSNTFNFVNGLAQITACFGVNLYDEVLVNINQNLVGTVTVGEAERVLSLFNVINGELVIMDDLFIDTNSQLGQGFDDGVSYNGFTRLVKIFDADDFSDNRAIPSAPGITHSLETMNNTIINDIVSALDIGVIDNNIITLHDGYNQSCNLSSNAAFSFVSDYSGSRVFSVSNANISIYHFDSNNCLVYDCSSVSSATLTFEKNVEYLIVATPNNTGSSIVSFYPNDTLLLASINEVEFGSDDKSVYSVSVDNAGYYLITLSNTYVQIDNATLIETDRYYKFFEEGVNYLYFSNTSNYPFQTNISIQLPQDIPNTQFSITAPNRVWKFTNTYGSTLNFQIVINWQSVANAVNVYCENTNFENCAIGTISQSTATYIFTLSDGETCYILFDNTNSTTTASFSVSSEQLFWKIDDDICESNLISLPRGYTYDVSLCSLVDGVYTEVNCSIVPAFANNSSYECVGNTFTIFENASIGDEFTFVNSIAIGEILRIEIEDDFIITLSAINYESTAMLGFYVNKSECTIIGSSSNSAGTKNIVLDATSSYQSTSITNHVFISGVPYNTTFTFSSIVFNGKTFNLNQSKIYTVNTVVGGGAGTSEDPYLVNCFRHLNNVRNYSSRHFKQTQNITLSSTTNWTPIYSFSGVYDGGGYRIYNLAVNVSANDTDYGLFGKIYGTVKNLTIQSFNVSLSLTSSTTASRSHVGGISGYLHTNATILNCAVTYGTIDADIFQLTTGGISGVNFGTISNCRVSNLTMYVSGRAGGIVGESKGVVENCSASINLTHYWLANTYTGGIVGWNTSGGSVTNCSSSGTMTWNSTEKGDHIYPAMGKIIGLNSGSYTGCSSTISEDISYYYWYFIGYYDQSVYCFKVDNGLVGRQG